MSFSSCVHSLSSMVFWFWWQFSLFEELQGSFSRYILQPDGIIWNLKICISLKNTIHLSSPVMELDVAISIVKTSSQMCFEWILDSQWKLLTAWTMCCIHHCSLRCLISKTKRTKHFVFGITLRINPNS